MFWTRLASGVVLLALAIGTMSLGGNSSGRFAVGGISDCLPGIDEGIEMCCGG